METIQDILLIIVLVSFIIGSVLMAISIVNSDRRSKAFDAYMKDSNEELNKKLLQIAETAETEDAEPSRKVKK